MSYTYGTDAGVPDLSRTELATEILKLHPDFWNQRYTTAMSGDPFFFETSVPQTARDGMDIAASLALPASLGFGWMPYDVPLDQRPADNQMSGYLYDLPATKQWPAPDGSPAEHPLHVSTARDFTNNTRRYMQIGNTAAYSVSLYAPGPTTYHLTNHEHAPLYGANATEMDLASDASNLMTGDFSVWAQRAFREYLRKLPPARLARLDVDNIDQFDIQTYTQAIQRDVETGTKTEEDVVHDPVLYEFRLMENRRILEYYKSYRARGHKSADQVESPLTTLGNQQTRVISTKSNAAILLSQVYDLIEVENPITIPGRTPATGNAYLASIRTATHKLVAAMAQTVEKPAVEHGFYGTGGWTGTLDPGKQYPTLQTLNFAEVYANGSTRQLDLDGWNGLPPDSVALMWMNPDSGSVPTALRPLADFLWLHRQDLRGAPNSDVAVVYSIPTLLGQLRPFIGCRGDQEAKRVDGWVRAARERQIPTDMVIFGHPELWDDTDTLERLSSYQTLVLPFADALTDAQIDAVRTFVEQGGTALIEGNLGTHDEYYRPRDDDLAGLDGVRDLTEAGSRAADGETATAGDALETSLESPLVTVDGPPTLSCEVIETDDGWLNVHLVNYDYDSDTDAIDPVTDIDLSLHDTEGAVHAVDLIAPTADPVPLTSHRDGEYVSVTVPEVDVWGVVRFKTATRTTDATESEAQTAIDRASDALEDVSANGRSIPLAIGEAAIYEANLAHGAGQFDRAIENAERAESQITPAQKTLHIGIYSGNGQDPVGTYDGLREFREKYGAKYELSFAEITAFTPEQLDGLDGVLIGPAFPYKDQYYTFTEGELATLERFVEAGGRLGVVVSESVDESINRVTERFEITVDPRKIYTLDMWDDNSIRTEPAAYRTPITYQILDEGWMSHACTLTNLGDDVTVQIQSKPNTVRDADEDPNAYPVSAVSRRGDGAVVVHTSEKLLTELRFNFEVQARNILRFIGNTKTTPRAADLISPKTTTTPTGSNADTETTSPTATKSTGSTATQTTSTTTPGFGITSTLIGTLTALVYAVQKWTERED